MKTKRGGKHIFFNFRSSLLLWIIGIFLFSNLAVNHALASDITRNKLIELTNLERAKYGLTELTENALLKEAAEAKANAIINQQKFSNLYSLNVSNLK